MSISYFIFYIYILVFIQIECLPLLCCRRGGPPAPGANAPRIPDRPSIPARPN